MNTPHTERPNRGRDIFSRPRCIIEAEQSSKPRMMFVEVYKFILVLLVSSLITAAVLYIPMMAKIYGSDVFTEYTRNPSDGALEAVYNAIAAIMAADWYMILSLFATTATIASAVFYCTRRERRPITSMGFVRRGAVSEYLAGLLAGSVAFAAAAGICLLSGSVKIIGISPVLSPAVLSLYFVAFMVQGMSEEVLCRGYFLVSVSRRYSLSAAIFVSSVLFALLHMGNSGISAVALLNLILFGIFAAVYFIKRGSIWGIAAFHSIWNFAQGNIFGISVSGSNMRSSLLLTEFSETGALLNGGGFGLEGGYAVTAVLLASILIAGFMKPARREQGEPAA